MEAGSTFATIFRTVVGITIFCGVVAVGIAVLPVIWPNAADTPFLEPMFNTLTYLFSTGVGAIFGMIGSRA